MKLICPECKNDVDLSAFSTTKLKRDDVVECNVCGISLMIEECGDDGSCVAQVVDEGK